MDNKQIKVLLIEDHPKVADLSKRTLGLAKSDQFELTHTKKLSDALEYLEKKHFDVILMDISLPGFETFVKIRSQIIQTPIIVLTELEDENLALRMIQEGAQDYLVKQYVDDIIIERVIRYAIGRSDLLEGLRNLSLKDELTGLYNRRGFLVLAEQQLKLSVRIKKKILVIYIDIDGMKWINDTMGHQQGDMALKDTANILKKSFREADIIARIGGDEFVVFAVETSEDSAEMLMARLYENINSYNTSQNRPLNLALSIGTTIYDYENPCNLSELLVLADKLMYENKKHKSNH